MICMMFLIIIMIEVMKEGIKEVYEGMYIGGEQECSLTNFPLPLFKVQSLVAKLSGDFFGVPNNASLSNLLTAVLKLAFSGTSQK